MDHEAEYNNRALVPEHPGIIAGWVRDAAAFRAGWAEAALDLPYGPGERERLDLFRPGPGENWPVALFVHGGYWQSLDRRVFSHCARGLLAHGVAVAVPSYDLCPAVPLDRITEQLREAAAFLHRRSGRRLLAMGHSAGGHASAMLMATDWAARGLPAGLVPAALPISGVFELWPLLGTSINAALGLDETTARAHSPALLLPPAGGRLHAVVGDAESGEFRRQTRDFAAHWGGSWEALPGANHFTVLAPLAGPEHPLVRRAALLARGG
ncbi:alpha/beta hydrolase [Paeniroseomonas aquatica]|uniref:Alpha/beta hydrolase n=1 Tax=Paeniroseomonas aquatica TaxID=373043 RepID=A0ABT8ACW5_9PROT|nr:alpha/beta hydrolase [Paeniroseomonas aquatica]MDN3567683.1 alpha/beta hydrolase [Paeniroseomonas aquatica]